MKRKWGEGDLFSYLREKKEAETCDVCGCKADRVKMDGCTYWEHCGLLWGMHLGEKCYFAPDPPMQTPDILAKLEQEMRQ